MGFWTNFGQGERFKFVNPGDTVEGEVLRLSATDFGGQADLTPVILLRSDQGEKEITASQTVLCNKLAEAAPEVGDWVKITFDGEADKARPGRSPAKLFTVTVKRADPQKRSPEPPPSEFSDEPF
ncbi:MAG: hypothetical protein ACREJP_08795 [Candidatus Methylomirabilales bacterium]